MDRIASGDGASVPDAGASGAAGWSSIDASAGDTGTGGASSAGGAPVDAGSLVPSAPSEGCGSAGAYESGVYADGTGTLRSWNGGGCCGAAVTRDIDDVGFVRALLDHVESSLCVDRNRVFASGMSNGAILSHRLACELADRLAAIAPVAGTDLTSTCSPARPIAMMHTHGTVDGHVPWDGGEGCGPTVGVNFTSVPETLERWRTRNGCSPMKSVTLAQGDGRCETYQGCTAGADVTLCAVEGGGHNWPGGQPPADLADCPENGEQSSTFHASEVVWSFLRAHPLRTQ